jgi:hypothetical protein
MFLVPLLCHLSFFCDQPKYLSNQIRRLGPCEIHEFVLNFIGTFKTDVYATAVVTLLCGRVYISVPRNSFAHPSCMEKVILSDQVVYAVFYLYDELQ